MADKDVVLQPAAEFQSLPLEFIVAAPLTAAVRAQAFAASTTKEFIDSLLTKDKNGKATPTTIDLVAETTVRDKDGKTSSNKVDIKAPVLALVPVPHLRIDSITTHFTYTISHTLTSKESSTYSAEGSVKAGGLLGGLLGITLSGNVSSQSTADSTMNRSGSLEITVHASEAPIPEGLAKLLSLLSSSVVAQPAT